MTMDARQAREREAMRQQSYEHIMPEEKPDAQQMGAEEARYATSIDPQWMPAWKMFVDREGREYGVPVRVPRKMWSSGGANALENMRRPDGGYWFTLWEPERTAPPAKYECFVGECRKRLDTRSKLVSHIETFHYDEAKTYEAILRRIKEKVAEEDPRLQRLMAELDAAPPDPEITEEEERVILTCDQCGEEPPDDHQNPAAWLRGHKLGGHKEEQHDD